MKNKSKYGTNIMCIFFSSLILLISSCQANSSETSKTEQYGVFYELEEAYTNGLLTRNDLENISYYYYEETIAHDHSECDLYIPSPKTPEQLSSETQKEIKNTYLSNLKTRGEIVTLGNIQITNYLGTYNDCIIVGVTNDYFRYDYLFEPERIIGGILFRSYCEAFARVWKLN